MSALLKTMELIRSDGGTLLIDTKQDAYLNGFRGAGRPEGMRELLETLLIKGEVKNDVWAAAGFVDVELS
ncbi:MAG: hypothetical protein LPK88_05080 [Alphaproteobacteria bacterium]|nr:hypothetical protein [Alphaproteobacteria bacterium]MDX5415676.1 hypothetical protein [Alphaproteobacteria bacterium]MDX5492938.1 hypothetical protein [Alphaproteobacteria bacterium]